jgi:opacity protein-like surface antigen
MNPGVKTVKSDGVRLGINFGLAVENYFAPNYAFATGITISTTGGKLIYRDSVPNANVTYKLQYITIPFAVKLKTNRIGYFSYYAILGLTSQINIKANADINNTGDNDISKDINLINLGYHFGGGVEYALGGNASIFVGIIYTNGFTNVTSGNDDKVTLDNFALKLGIMF